MCIRDRGNAVMVDVGGKEITDRVAVAKGIIRMQRATFDAIAGGTAKKGDVLGVARVAGIMAAKRTSELIPLCHPLMLTKCTVDFKLHPDLQMCIRDRCLSTARRSIAASIWPSGPRAGQF